MQEVILAISGRPGLYRLVSRGRGTLIVETIDATKKRFAAGPREQVTALNDISMYTDVDDKPLMEIFQTIKETLEGAKTDVNIKTATATELAEFMGKALPNYDRDRVHNSDIKKLIQWYNILTGAGLNDFVSEEVEGTESE